MASLIPLYIKHAYHDEPCFHDVKIVTSLSHVSCEGISGKNAKNSIAFRDITRETLASYPDDFKMKDLEKLAIDFSDAVVEVTPENDEELKAHAKEVVKTYLDYPGEDFAEAYKALYDSL